MINGETEQERLAIFLSNQVETAPVSDAKTRSAPQSGPQVVCEFCWQVFVGVSQELCPGCGRPAPRGGWALMPYRFRERFIFLELVARGGMGAVFLAQDEQAPAEQAGERDFCAIKVVQQIGGPQAQREMEDRFSNEAGAAILLARSDSFVRIMGHEVTSPPYLLMEFVDWPTLSKLLADGPLPPLQVARLGVALLKGVARMHRFNIIHRDLKPANIFAQRIDEEPGYAVKITDMGIWVRDEDLTGTTTSGQTGTLVGTISYMSPEQLQLLPAGARSDLHTIGSVLWELSTGEVPFLGEGPTAVDRIQDRARRVSQPLERPDFMPEGLYRILSTVLALAPKDRWANADEMRIELEGFVVSTLKERQKILECLEHQVFDLSMQVTGLQEQLRRAADLKEWADSIASRVAHFQKVKLERDPSTLERAVNEISSEISQINRHLDRSMQPADDMESTDEAKEHRGPMAAGQGWKRSALSVVALISGLVLGLLLAWAFMEQGGPSAVPPDLALKDSVADAGHRMEIIVEEPVRVEEPPLPPGVRPVVDALDLEVLSDPSGARVLLNGAEGCSKTPCVIRLGGKGPFEIQVQKKLCKTFRHQFENLDQLRRTALPRPVVLELE